MNEVRATDTKQDVTSNAGQDARALLPRVDVLEDVARVEKLLKG